VKREREREREREKEGNGGWQGAILLSEGVRRGVLGRKCDRDKSLCMGILNERKEKSKRSFVFFKE